MTNIIYDKSLLNDNACSSGKLLKEAFRVGGIELVNKLIVDGLRTASDSSCVLEYVDIRTGSLLFSFDTSCSIDSIESSAQSVVHLRPVETPELIALKESASDPFYMPLMQVLSYIAKVHANAWHWIGGVMELIQNIVEHTLPALQTDSQTARLSFLFDLLDHVRSADPFITSMIPWGPGDPDDFGGGDSNDKKADGEGVSLMFYASSDNTSSELVNASLVGETLGLESDSRMY